MRELAALLAGDPLRVAVGSRNLAVERHRRLEEDPWLAGPGVLAERLVEQPCGARRFLVGNHDLDAVVAQNAETAAVGLLGRVVACDDDAANARRNDRVGARRCAAVVAAGLERDVESGLR